MATATAMLVSTGAASWWWMLRGSLVAIALMVAVATVTVLLAAELLAYRSAAVLLAGWLAAAVGVAGVPAGQLLPPAWPALLARLAGGVERLTALDTLSGPIANQPWSLAAWLLLAGAVWVAGAALATSRPSAQRRAIAFVLLAAPWIAAVAARHSDQAAWHGAAVLLAGLLWLADQRLSLRRVLALGLAVGLVSVGITQAIGPRTRWFTHPPPSVRFVALDSELTYGPLQGRRSGATLLQITAAQPALWRMRVLDLFTGAGWRVDSPRPELPQPAAKPVEVKVVVRGLANDLLVAPGRINAVHAHSTATPAPGEAWRLTPSPRRGDTYQVQASVVRASAEQLQHVPAPTDPRLRADTSLFPGYGWHSSAVVPLFGQPPDPQVTATLDLLTPYGPVAALARRLAAGAPSQWEVVARVHRYLLDGGRFRYTTNLPPPGAYPLVDFLLRDHAGDCQHFAGAAALLLRLAGVPARVVVGFATGVPQPGGRFTVRDVDAHAWIEVYFQGIGWVAFNPTPAAAQATIPPQLDPLAPTSATPSGGHDAHGGPDGLGWLTVGVILAALATAGVRVARRRSRRGPVPLGPLLEGLVRRTGGQVQPSSTLADLGIQLARLVGPQTAALATQTEGGRFAPRPPPPTPHPRLQLARAIANDLGPRRALLVLITPAATRQAHQPPP